MGRDTWAYREVALESVPDPRSGALVLRPVPGQAFAPTLQVQAARALRDPSCHPAGTRFLVSAKLTDRLGGTPYLFVYHGDPVVVLDDAATKRFLAEFRRGRL